jgi:hypothetical protein
LVRLVVVQLSVVGLYLPPVTTAPELSTPPHTIISLPVQAAVWRNLALGALVVLVAVQLLVVGLYLPPVSVPLKPVTSEPPQMIISVPVQTAVWTNRALGALVRLVGVQLSVAGSYLPPLSKTRSGVKGAENVTPPQTIISAPVHTAVLLARIEGWLVVLIADHMLLADQAPPAAVADEVGAGAINGKVYAAAVVVMMAAPGGKLVVRLAGFATNLGAKALFIKPDRGAAATFFRVGSAAASFPFALAHHESNDSFFTRPLPA